MRCALVCGRSVYRLALGDDDRGHDLRLAGGAVSERASECGRGRQGSRSFTNHCD